MKSLTISQSTFEAVELSSFTFTATESNRVFEHYQYPDGVDDDGEIELSDGFKSFVAGEVTAKYGELVIQFYWVANGGNETYSDAFDFTINIEDNDTHKFLTNFVIVDEDGDEVQGWNFDDLLDEKLSGAEWEKLVETLLPEPDINDIEDTDEDTDMETFTLEIDNAPNFRFTGEILASVSSSDNQAMGSSYSGQTGRWTELDLYKTKGGKFVCHQIGRTRWQDERDRYTGKVCDTPEEVKEFFGHRWLAKALYEDAGIDDAVDIE